jgi:nucleotide-binding universal stress UspA family protein
MKKILCPTDFTKTADNAIVYAAKLARKINAGVTLINVQVLAELTMEQAVWGREMNVQAATSRLEELSEEVTRVFKIPCGFEAESSNLSLSKIISTRALGYDLIVMGTQGTHTLSNFFWGTHTYRVIRDTHIPVLLVPEECVYSEIKQITYAFDYKSFDQLPMAQIIKLSRSLGSEITVLQVIEEPYSQQVEAKLKQIQEQVKQFYPESEAMIRFDTIHADELATGINSYMLRNMPDLLALCAVHHSFIQRLFHKSVIKTISGIATYPVFVFH